MTSEHGIKGCPYMSCYIPQQHDLRKKKEIKPYAPEKKTQKMLISFWIASVYLIEIFLVPASAPRLV